MKRPYLIITADDYGLSPLFNKAIQKLACAGLVTEISVMIRRKYIRRDELLRLKIPLGLHLELTENTPLKEIRSQVLLFRKRFGHLPAYLDGHQHKHLTPHNLQKVIRLAKEFSLPVRSRFPEDRRDIRAARIFTPDNFISWHPSRLSVLKEKLHQAKKFQLSELVVHPGYYDKRCAYPYNRERREELAFLESLAFRKLLKAFVLQNYKNTVQ